MPPFLLSVFRLHGWVIFSPSGFDRLGLGPVSVGDGPGRRACLLNGWGINHKIDIVASQQHETVNQIKYIGVLHPLAV